MAEQSWTRKPYVVLVLGIIAFTVYGSLVPFNFQPRHDTDVFQAFDWAVRHRIMFESRSDALANVLLGMPLGFGLLGLTFVRRPPNPVQEIMLGIVLLPGCALFAASIEFAQLFVPSRTCAASDVLCQVIGALIGMAIWIGFGRRLTAFAQEFWSGTGSAQRALLAYLALVTFIQLLPLDLNASPRSAAKKAWRDVNYVPFGELLDASRGEQWPHVAKLAKVYGLFVPVGLLASRLSGRFWHEMVFHHVIALAVATAFILEAIQLPIESRMPSATDVVAGAIGIISGWAFGWIRRPAFPGGNLMGYFSWWLLVLVVIWGPLPFPPHIRTPPATFDWMPGLPFESGNPLFALEDMLTKLILFGLGGVMIGALDAPLTLRSRCLIGMGLALTISGGIEACQIVFGTHTPSITDVMLGGIGALFGTLIAERMQ